MQVSQCICKIDNLLQKVRQSFLSGRYSNTYLIRFTSTFSIQKLCYEPHFKNQLSLSRNSLLQVLRIIQILILVRTLLLTGQTITKRSLYYKLIKYYKFYAQIDDDIEIITSTLQISRSSLNIIASNRCVISGNIIIICDGIRTQLNNSVITNIPNCQKFQIQCSKLCKLIIVEKESAFYSLHHDLCNFKTTITNNTILLELIQSIVMITAKGYPDYLTRFIISDLQQSVSQIYYIGDEDVYGFDILLCYALNPISNYHKPYQSSEVLLHKIKWLQPKQLIIYQWVSLDQLSKQMLQITMEDRKKYKEILNREEFKLEMQDKPLQMQFQTKINNWRTVLNNIITSGKKCQLEAYIKCCQKQGWIANLILSGAYK